MHASLVHASTSRLSAAATVSSRNYCSTPKTGRRLHLRSAQRQASPPGAVDGAVGAQQEPASATQEEADAPPVQAGQQEEQFDVVMQLRLHLGTANIPHPDKEAYGGEDAFFISDIGGGAFGVADGVGGWADSKVNPAEYAKTFMIVAQLYLEGKDVRWNEDNGSVLLMPADSTATFDGNNARSPQGALDAGHVATRLPGSATACVVRLNRESSSISAANLGDSGFLVVRDGFVAFRSPVLQHFFDCPLQFGAVPEHTNASDYAEDADLFDIDVRIGDLIIAASDGLWDNARDDEMIAALSSAEDHPDNAAQALAELAKRNAEDEGYESPYTVEALRQGIDLPWVDKLLKSTFSRGAGFKLGKLEGGKMDDITVLVARVKEEEVRVPRQQPALEQGAAEQAATSEPTTSQPDMSQPNKQ